MRQLTVTGKAAVEWQDADDPAVQGPGEAIVRPLAVSLCDLDRAMVLGTVPIPPPLALGHECVGEVVEVGDAVRSVAPGDRVLIPYEVSCGECGRCRRGYTAMCESVQPGSAYGFGAIGGNWGGALSDAVRVPYADHMLLPAPADVRPVDLAAVTDNMADGYRTVAPGLEAYPGGDVAIVAGAAPSIGLYAVDVARALGAGRIVYVDTDRDRLEMAERFGAEVVEGPPPERLGSFPVTVDASSDPAGLSCALRSTEPGGTCTSIGIYFGAGTEVPLFEMYVRGITFVTSRCHARPAMPPLLDLIAAGKLHPAEVISTVAGWEDAPEAVKQAERKLVISRE